MKIRLLVLMLIVYSLISCNLINRKSAEEILINNEIAQLMNEFKSDNWEIRLKSVVKASKYSKTHYSNKLIPLMTIALDDYHPEIRIEALRSLFNIQNISVINKIQYIAIYDSNPNVRWFAFNTLSMYQIDKNENIFLDGMKDRDWLVKEGAVSGLLNINRTDIQKKNINNIIRLFNESGTSTKIIIFSKLTIKDPLVYQEAIKIINNKESGLSLLRAALIAIEGYNLDDGTKKRLVQLLIHSDKHIRILSLKALKSGSRIYLK